MRPEEEVLRALGEWATGERSVRAMLLVGSRASARQRVDALSDYDVLLFLRDPAALEADDAWLTTFGPILVMLRTGYEFEGRRIPTRLVQYADGQRIDFSLCPLDLLEHIAENARLPAGLDAGYRVLLDQDGLTTRLPAASGRAFVPQPPGAERFAAVVNEFWWETLYVAKHLARGELLPARFSAERVLRFECLLPMLEWYVEGARGWSQPLRSAGGGLRALLPAQAAALLDGSYAGAGVDENWEGLFAMVELFERAACAVAADQGYGYPEKLAGATRAYLSALRVPRAPS